jgi:hypothetical protein
VSCRKFESILSLVRSRRKPRRAHGQLLFFGQPDRFKTQVLGSFDEEHPQFEKFQGPRVKTGIMNGCKSMRDSVIYNQLEALFEVLIVRWGDRDEKLSIVEKDA